MEILKPITQKPTLIPLTWIILLLLVIGILFRFSHLDRKVYWHDEVFTSMEATAHTGSEIRANLFTGQVVEPAAVLTYQRIDPERTLAHLVFGIGSEDPQHPPLFYLLMHGWMRLWGDTVVVTRSLAALFSLLVFPGVYWLCQELFATPLVGGVAIALLAISPIHVVYAQEAREYSLLTALTLLSSAALLRAMRCQQWHAWVVYGCTLVLSFYTAVFSALVAIGHGIYVLFVESLTVSWIPRFQLQCRWTKPLLIFLLTGAIATIAFIPWLYFLITYSDVVKASTHWITISLPIATVFQMWLVNLSRLFLDIDTNPFVALSPFFWLAIAPFILLEIYAVYFLIKHAPKRAWLFLVAVLLGTSLPLIGPDLLMGGQRSVVTRYFLPFYLCLQMATAYLISHWLMATNVARRQAAILLAAILSIAGITSCGLHAQAQTWWNKLMSYHHPQIAQILNRSDRPLLLTDGYGYNPANLISLSYLLDPTVQLVLLQEVNVSLDIPTIADLSQPIFLLNLPDVFKAKFTETYGGDFYPVVGELWKWNQSPQ